MASWLAEFVFWNVLLEAIQAFGWGLLKLATFGRYTRRGGSDSEMIFEGMIGFAAIVIITWIVYRWA
jgi:hypothetical protein